jgi:hypothetical protein
MTPRALHEAADVLAEHLPEVALGRPLLDVGAVEAPDVLRREHRRHRLHRGERLAELIDELLLEDAGVRRRRVGVVGEHVPGAEAEVREVGERDELADPRRALLGALPEPHGGHLRERADGLRHAAADGLHPGDERRGHGAQAGQEHRELPLGRCDGRALLHGGSPP